MSLDISCPNCRARFRVAWEHLGRQGKCPKCNTQFVIAPMQPTSQRSNTAPAHERVPKARAQPQPVFTPAPDVALTPRERVAAQIRSLDGVSKLLGRRELKVLHEILWDDETILKIIQGHYNNGFGILVATIRRLVFVDKGMLWGLRVEDFPYDKITSIQYETGIVFGKVTIFASGNKAEITLVNKTQARTFADSVRAYIAEGGRSAAKPASQSSDPLERLERLARLRESGHITEQEYLAQKKRLLESH